MTNNIFHFEREEMKKVLLAIILFLLCLNFGCSEWHAQMIAEKQMKYNHEEKMAQIKNQKSGMSDKDKAQLADMIANRVVERLNQQQK